MNIPSNLLYTEEHEWVRIDGDIATVGITDFAQGELGDLVYIEVETVGDTLDSKEIFGTVEAVKTTSDLYMPVSGEIIEFNTALEDSPETINEDAYEGGWIVKIKMTHPAEVDSLLTAERYEGALA